MIRFGYVRLNPLLIKNNSFTNEEITLEFLTAYHGVPSTCNETFTDSFPFVV